MRNSNELNAAYAADGYARFRRGLSVIATTYVHLLLDSGFTHDDIFSVGVGELSAINGIAGCE
jgi:pyruvate decarboxylase